jgi:GTP-binding protein
MNRKKIINIAVIAHVDAGKSTLVDALLNYSGALAKSQLNIEQVMDSNDLERERGITIYSKNCSINYKDIKINIVDTPGHADFSSEVERIIATVDTVILLVDSSEGPMPQTRFVLEKSLERGLHPILLINKIDKRDQRAIDVVDMVYDLFVSLNATDKQLDFPILYGVTKEGVIKKSFDDEAESIEPLLETIVEHAGVYENRDSSPVQMQISALAYDEYIGRLGIGRLLSGVLKVGQQVAIIKNEKIRKTAISKLFIYQGTQRVAVNEVFSGDIVMVGGVDDISIGDTVCLPSNIMPMPSIQIEEPTLSVNFLVNTSPLAGKSGKYITSRNIKERLERELEVNVGLRVEATESADKFKVSGRGELHITILVENMRREGYELAVSKAEVITKTVDGKTMEPYEELIITVPEKYSGSIISKLNLRKAILSSMEQKDDYLIMSWEIPTRTLIGYRQEFINDTHGEGIIVRQFKQYGPYAGEINNRRNGVMISTESGTAMTYSIFHLQERGLFFIGPQTEVYEGMIVGIANKDLDMDVNPTKNKKGTAIRTVGHDEAMRLVPYRQLNLEMALEFIADDELVEVTPDALRLRKKFLKKHERKQFYRNND